MKEEFDFITTFPPLGHPEHHFVKYPNHPWLKTKKDILKWLKNNDRIDDNLDDYIINDDFTVSLPDGEIGLDEMNLKCIPVQFRNCHTFNCYKNSKLRSLIGTPYNCVELRASRTGVESLVGISRNIYSVEMYRSLKLKGFTGMPKNNKWSNLDVGYSPIESWADFTNCEVVYFWQREWNEKTSLNLIFETPKKITLLKLNETFHSGKIKLMNFQDLNMDWLRVEQARIEAERISINLNDAYLQKRRKI